MIGQLPERLTVSGEEYPINADFRNVLVIFSAFNDSALTAEEKAYICLRRLYKVPIPRRALEEAIRQAYWFLDGGDSPKSEPSKVKIMDWQHDEAMIMPAVSKTLGVIDIRALPYLHWWTFLGAFGELGEGLFSEVVHIREKLGKGEKLDKFEKKFMKNNKELIALRTEEDKQAIAETEEFLKKLLKEG